MEYRGEFLAFPKDHDGIGNFAHRARWRWKHGSWQMRVREEPVPKTLVHQQSYNWPDGTRWYQAIWQKFEVQEK